MIIQCEECKTRFRLADEKLKPTGTKVRCSKCKHVFTVMPPAPEPAEESVDFDAMNMEEVAEQASPPEESTASQPVSEEATQAEADDDQEPAPETEVDQAAESSSELDFSGLEQEMTATTSDRGELADDFSFAGTEASGDESQQETSEDQEVDSTEQSQDFAEDSIETGEAPSEFSLDQPDQGTGLSEPSAADEAPGFTFDDQQEAGVTAAGETAGEEFSFEDQDQSGAIDFEDSSSTPEASQDDISEQGEFALDDSGDAVAADSGDEPQEPPATEEFGMGDSVDEFSFDDDSSTDEWEDDEESTEGGFDFDAPAFETESPNDTTANESGDDLQFGEINFASDADEEAPAFETDNDFSEASFSKEEPSPGGTSPGEAQYQEPAPTRSIDEKPLAAPPIKRKSPLSRILVLLILLLIALGGAAAYFYMQDGSLDINRIIQRFTGETQPGASEHRIGINISGSSYVNNQSAGQLLVVQGEAINNFPTARSAITVKGVLLDAQGKTLFQQTVSCGNFLDDKTIGRMPFDKIEETMNNQFGDSLSNMNVAAGASIPFTIVFRNLPDGIANINVEIVGSKLGGG
ncbi:MAG: zinc-ribbon domain-containing protein [Desulfuromonadales bacterium]|jgi:predicted Zn finger-like uncharacterized protein|nr:zinc-ribbon domain-containing protein [Desulfuromonadales bacterium]